MFLAFVVTPLLCCALVSKESTGKGDAALRVIVDYILSPALVAYAVILLLYIVRILIRWELPDGGVAYMVLGFLSASLLCHLLRMQIPENQRHFEWFYRPFPYIALAPLVLLWIGAVRRVGEYGITGPRFYLVVLAAVVSLFVLRLFRERPYGFRRLFLAAGYPGEGFRDPQPGCAAGKTAPGGAGRWKVPRYYRLWLSCQRYCFVPEYR